MTDPEFKEAPTAEEVAEFESALSDQVLERFGVDEDGDRRVFMGDLRALTLHEPNHFELIPHDHKADTAEERAEIFRRIVYNARVANNRLFMALDMMNRRKV